MIQTKIVTYNKNKQTNFEEQINEVLLGIQTTNHVMEGIPTDIFLVVQDIKVINEHKVLIIYK